MSKPKDFAPFNSPEDKSAFIKRSILAGVLTLALPFLAYIGMMFYVITSVDMNQPQAQKPGLLIFMGIFYIFLFATPFILAGLLQSGINKYRKTTAKLANRNVRFATLWERGLALLIDLMVTMIPSLILAVVFGVVVNSIYPVQEKAFPWPVFAGFAFFFLCMVMFRLIILWYEGKSGLTPGRQAMKIRLLTLELKPCGFWKALLRSIVYFADSFVMYHVGAYFISFTENQQRVGDMAAGTVVVKEGD